MTDEMERLVEAAFQEIPSLYSPSGRALIDPPERRETAVAVVKAVLNELVGITRERSASGSIHDQQVHRYTTAGVASILGITQ